jgi:hypothetical protein
MDNPMNDQKIRVVINSQALVKLAHLVSNSVILSANAFLLGANVKSQIKERKNEIIAQRLQISAEIASAAASITKVIINSMVEQ